MATVLPFKAIRPVVDKVHLVASRSLDFYNRADLKDKLAGNPYTFLHVINPDYDDGQRTRPGSKERLLKIKSKFKSFLKERILLHDEKPAYFIYRQRKAGVEFTGIIACTAIDDYLNGTIKIHEQTITSREEKLKDYLKVCEFNAEPVLFCYPNVQKIDDFIYEKIKERADYDFTTTDRIQHTLWVVDEKSKLKLIESSFKSLQSIYIADGHHRSASSALLGKELRQANPKYTGKEAFNYFLGIFFAETQLKIYEYNRLVKDTDIPSLHELLNRLKQNFEVSEIPSGLFVPSQKHELSMYTQGKWFSLKAKQGTYNSDDAIGSLDASILTEHILSPIFGIDDLKTDKRISFVPGVKGPEALKESVDEERADVAFGLYPVTMEHLKWIADTNKIMPPKSTWVEPKMRSGLVVFNFDDEVY